MTLSEFAEILRSGHRAPVVEADEWRPLAQHIIELLKMQREACAAQARFYAGLGADADRMEEKVRATRLVTESDK